MILVKKRPVCTNPNCFYDSKTDKHLVGVMRTIIWANERTGEERRDRRMRVKLRPAGLTLYTCPKCGITVSRGRFKVEDAGEKIRKKKRDK